MEHAVKIWISPDRQTVLADDVEKPAQEFISELESIIRDATVTLAHLKNPRSNRQTSKSTIWTAKQETELRMRHASGESYSLIAEAMGITREKVAGKCNRLGLIRNSAQSATMKRRWAIAKAAEANAPVPNPPPFKAPISGHRSRWTPERRAAQSKLLRERYAELRAARAAQ